MTEKERADWLTAAKPLILHCDQFDVPLVLRAKLFSSGSLGWHCSTKVVISDSSCQVGFCVTLVGTKREGAAGVVDKGSRAKTEDPETPQALFEGKKASRRGKTPPKSP